MRIERDTWFLGILAAVLCLGVYFTLTKPPSGHAPAAGGGEIFLPDFAAAAEAAETITLAADGGATTLVFDGDIWRVAERNGYPADQARVTALLRGLGMTRKVDPKTADERFFERLGLTGRGPAISVAGRDGAPLATLKTGDQFYDPTGEGIMTFVLDPASRRAWTVSSLPELSVNPSDWLRAEVVRVSERRLKGLTVTIGGNEAWSVAKATPVEPGFRLEGEGGAQANVTLVDAAGLAITGIYLKDVANREGLELFRIGEATYRTFDGLSVRMVFYDRTGEIWTTFEAAYDPAVLMTEDTPKVLLDVPADGAAEAAALNREWQGRIFLLPIEKLAEILKNRSELFKRPSASGQS